MRENFDPCPVLVIGAQPKDDYQEYERQVCKIRTIITAVVNSGPHSLRIYPEISCSMTQDQLADLAKQIWRDHLVWVAPGYIVLLESHASLAPALWEYLQNQHTTLIVCIGDQVEWIDSRGRRKVLGDGYRLSEPL
jgi:hypothetical protein